MFTAYSSRHRLCCHYALEWHVSFALMHGKKHSSAFLEKELTTAANNSYIDHKGNSLRKELHMLADRNKHNNLVTVAWSLGR
jgi:ribosomal protein S7